MARLSASLVALLLSVGSSAHAQQLAEAEPFEVVAARSAGCGPRGALCVSSAAAATLDLPSEPVAASSHAAPPRRLGRASVDAASDAPWTVRIDAELARPALPGNAIVLVSDTDDLGAGYVTAVRQAAVPGGSRFAARFNVSPVDGVLPGRVYRVRVVQLVNRHEVVLAEGYVRLE
jgi:hypothetical protein